MIAMQKINSTLSLSAPRYFSKSGVEFTRVIASLGSEIYVTERSNAKKSKPVNVYFGTMAEAESYFYSI